MFFELILITSRSITVEINNNLPYYAKEDFAVYLNGEVIIECEKKNVFSVYNLLPNSSYEICVKNKQGEKKKRFTTKKEYVTLDVYKFNATGDGKTDDTIAIQTAIYACPDKGRVLIPKGTYYVKPIFLKSNITIELSKGATLLGNINRNDYPILPGTTLLNDESDDYILGTWEGNPLDIYASIITGINIENVDFIGEGIVDANAQNSDWWENHRVRRGAFRPRGVFLNKCNNITFQGITVCNTPAWNLHPFFSNKIRFLDMKIISPSDSPNTDGCDPESCNGVDIIGVDFSVGDDCIAIKAGKIYMGAKYRTPSQNFQIRNCIMKFGHGAVVLGSEMSGGIRNINVSKCIFKETDRGLRIKTRRGRGKQAIIDEINFENIYMDSVKTPLVINMFYFCDPDGKTEYVWSKEKWPVDDKTPLVNNVCFKDIIATNCEHSAGVFWGLPEQPIKSVKFENVKITFKENAQKGNPALLSYVDSVARQGLLFTNVCDVSLKNVSISGYDGDMIIKENVKKIDIKQ